MRLNNLYFFQRMGLVIFLNCERLWLAQKGLTPVPILQTELHYFLIIVILTVFYSLQ